MLLIRSWSSSLLLFVVSAPFNRNQQYFRRVCCRCLITMGPKKKTIAAKKLTTGQRQELARRAAILKRMVQDDSEESSASASEESSDEPQKPPPKKTKPNDVIFNPTNISVDLVEDFACDARNEEGELYNFKISSWNVNGMRAIVNKDGLRNFIKFEKPDIVCVQETKCSEIQLPEGAKFEGYTSYWLSGDIAGYSGVGLYTKIAPLNIKFGIGDPEHDKEGRVITAEFEKFTLVNAYVPNSGRKLVRLEYRKRWDIAFRNYLKELDAIKPVILCGDLNVAHTKIDLAKPKTNTKNAGFTPEERDGFTELLSEGFVDTFRLLHPNVTNAYTFWTFMMSARAKDIGWRLDYFVVSKQLLPHLCDSLIRKNVLGSDHCPITLALTI